MKAELRIGNTFDYHSQNVYVLEIKRHGAEFGYFIDSIGFFREYDSKDFPKPIAITEDWLLDFGFNKSGEKNNKYWWKTYGRGGVVILKYSEHYERYLFELGKGFDKVLENVHDLQNGWNWITTTELSLTNKELK